MAVRERTMRDAPGMPLPATRRPMGVGAIIGTIFACLLVGHLAIATYVPWVFANAVGVILVTLIIGRVLFVRNDVFATVLIVLFCSHFSYANNQGGLFNLVAFLLFLLYLIMRPPIRETMRADSTMTACLVVLFISNLAGLVLRNPMPLPIVVLEAAAFSGILLAFYVGSCLRLTELRLRQFVGVASVMVAFNFFVSLNQHYGTILLATPLIGMSEDLFYATSNAFGTFMSASANGQYAMMILALLLPLIAASAFRGSLRVRAIYSVPVIVMCALTLILANMRAAALEAGIIVLIYTVIFSLMHRRSFRKAKYLNAASAIAIVLLATVGFYFNLDNIAADFQSVQVRDLGQIESGEALNRRGPWEFGWERLQEENFLIGYGHGNDTSNLVAWGIRDDIDPSLLGPTGHLHNLYLALPMMYGWTGAIAYVLIFATIVVRLWSAVRRYPFSSLSTVACLGFLVSLFFFLLDEVKSGNAVQTFNYAMVSWIWAGLGLAAWRTVRSEAAAARQQRPQQPRGVTPAEEVALAEDDPDAEPPL